MLLLPGIALASAWLLTVGVSLAWGGQSHSTVSPPPQASGPCSASSPPPPATGEEPREEISVDSAGIIRIGNDYIEVHPTGYVRVGDHIEVAYVKNEETPAAGGAYDVRTLNVRIDGNRKQPKEVISELHDPNNPGASTPLNPHNGPGTIRVVGNGRVTANRSSLFEVKVYGAGGVVYDNNASEATRNTEGLEGFEAAFGDSGSVKYRKRSGSFYSASVNPSDAGHLVSPARHLGAYLSNGGGFEWGTSGEGRTNLSLAPKGVGEVAYGGGHHGFGAVLSNGGNASYAANEGGDDGVFSILPTGAGTLVSGRHAFGAHFVNGGGVEYRSGESFSILVHKHAATVVSGAHGFAAHFDDGGGATYEMADNSFKLHAICAGEVSSLRHHHFRAKFTDGGSIEQRAELGDFTVKVTKDGEVTYGGGGAGHGVKDEKKKNLRVQLTRRDNWQENKTLKTGSITHKPEKGFVVKVNGPSTVTISDTTAIGEHEQPHEVVRFKGIGTVRFDSSGREITAMGEVETSDEPWVFL